MTNIQNIICCPKHQTKDIMHIRRYGLDIEIFKKSTSKEEMDFITSYHIKQFREMQKKEKKV